MEKTIYPKTGTEAEFGFSFWDQFGGTSKGNKRFRSCSASPMFMCQKLKPNSASVFAEFCFFFLTLHLNFPRPADTQITRPSYDAA